MSPLETLVFLTKLFKQSFLKTISNYLTKNLFLEGKEVL